MRPGGPIGDRAPGDFAYSVSTAALAKEAGISKETLYSRYPSKDAVLTDLLEHLIGAMQSEALIHPVLETATDLEQALTSLAREFAHQLTQRDYVELIRIVIAELPRLPHIGSVFRGAVPERTLQVVTALLQSARDAGLVRVDDLAAASRMFVGPILLHVVYYVLLVAPGAPAPTVNFDVDTHVALFLKVIDAKD